LHWESMSARDTYHVFLEWYIILGILIALSVLVTVKHNDIIEWIKPGVHKLKSWPAGWVCITPSNLWVILAELLFHWNPFRDR
jgi:hypothetical protein